MSKERAQIAYELIKPLPESEGMVLVVADEVHLISLAVGGWEEHYLESESINIKEKLRLEREIERLREQKSQLTKDAARISRNITERRKVLRAIDVELSRKLA